MPGRWARRALARWGSAALVTTLVTTLVAGAGLALSAPHVAAAPTPDGRVAAGGTLRVSVPEAVGGKTVIGQLTVDLAIGPGFVTAYPCDDGLPTDSTGAVSRSDLNYDGRVAPVASNRLIVEADDAGEVCFYTLQPAALIVDVNAASFDTGISSFPNRRTDTRSSGRLLAAGEVLRVSVPEAAGGRTVVGQLTVDQVSAPGFVTAYPCDDGLPQVAGAAGRSDLNYDPNVAPFASNRLVVAADGDGDVCFYTLAATALVVDVNGVSDVGIESFANVRTDTRARPQQEIAGGAFLRVNVPQAVGRKTVLGQLTVDRVTDPGFVTAYGCDDGIPQDDRGAIARSDVNYDGRIAPFASNRLVVQADADGDVCFTTLRDAALVVDVNGVSDIGIQSFPNRRVDTRTDSTAGTPGTTGTVPVWPPFTPGPAVDGVAALTGAPAGSDVTARPTLAVKIDNFGPARPQWALDEADVVFELNVEGVTRFLALFHTRMPTVLGPIRSARTADIELVAGMNRPIFAFSGANTGTTGWIESAASSGMLTPYSSLARPCYGREPSRPGPHNLLLDPACARSTVAGDPVQPGPARPLWAIDDDWEVPTGIGAVPATTPFDVAMDGVATTWTWDAATRTYLRSQDGLPHLAVSGQQIGARNVVLLRAVHVPSPVDARSPNPITTGTGDAVLVRDGVAIPVVWSRASLVEPFQFFDRVDGAPVPLAVGTTFVQVTRPV